jgi:hypothetical protein
MKDVVKQIYLLFQILIFGAGVGMGILPGLGMYLSANDYSQKLIQAVSLNVCK